MPIVQLGHWLPSDQSRKCSETSGTIDKLHTRRVAAMVSTVELGRVSTAMNLSGIHTKSASSDVVLDINLRVTRHFEIDDRTVEPVRVHRARVDDAIDAGPIDHC